MNTSLTSPEQFDFPFKPYQIQYEFMKKLYQLIESRSLGIFESPTGTVSHFIKVKILFK